MNIKGRTIRVTQDAHHVRMAQVVVTVGALGISITAPGCLSVAGYLSGGPTGNWPPDRYRSRNLGSTNHDISSRLVGEEQ